MLTRAWFETYGSGPARWHAQRGCSVTTQRSEQAGQAGTGWIGRANSLRFRAGALGIASLVLMGTAGHAVAAPAAAQEIQTGESTGSCRIPTDDDRAPLSDGTSGVSPISDLASPVADPAAQEAAGEIDLVIRALATCLSEGDFATVTDLAAGDFLGTLAGVGGTLDAATYQILAEDLPTTPVRVRSVSGIALTGDGEATADVVYAIANQLLHGRWTFTQVDAGSDATGGSPRRRWIVASEEPLAAEPPAGAAEVDVTLDEYAITIDPDEAEGPDVVLTAENAGDDEHEVLLLRVDAGGDVQDLLTEPGPDLPAGLVFGAQVTVPAGAEATVPLVGLEPGTYAIVSLLLTADGTTDLAQGMDATFTISD